MSHSLHMSKLQSDLEYRKGFEDSKCQCHISLDMIHLAHARQAQALATDIGYRTASHHFTSLPTDMKVEWAKKAYGLQSDVSCVGVCVHVHLLVQVSPHTASDGKPASASLSVHTLVSLAFVQFHTNKQKVAQFLLPFWSWGLRVAQVSFSCRRKNGL